MNLSDSKEDKQGEEKTATIDWAAELRETAARRRNQQSGVNSAGPIRSRNTGVWLDPSNRSQTDLSRGTGPYPRSSSNRKLKRRHHSSNSPRSRVPVSPLFENSIPHHRGYPTIRQHSRPSPKSSANSEETIRSPEGPEVRREKTNFTTQQDLSGANTPETMSVDMPSPENSSVQMDADHALALHLTWEENERARGQRRHHGSRRRTLPGRLGPLDHPLGSREHALTHERHISRLRPTPSWNDAIAANEAETVPNIALSNPNQSMQVDYVPETEASTQNNSSSQIASTQIEEDERLARQLQANDYNMNDEDAQSEIRVNHPLRHNIPHEFDVDTFPPNFRNLMISRPPWFGRNPQQPFPFQMTHQGEFGDDFWSARPPHFTRMRSDPGTAMFSQMFNTVDMDAFFGAMGPRRRNQGANRSTINELPTRKFVIPEQKNEESKNDEKSGSGDKQKSCCICMEDFKDAEDVRTLPCLHIFHTNCIDSWLVRSRTCPICKLDITKNNAQISR